MTIFFPPDVSTGPAASSTVEMSSVLMQTSAALEQTCNPTTYENKVIFRPVRQITKTYSYTSVMHVRPFVRLPFRMEQLGFHLTDFH